MKKNIKVTNKKQFAIMVEWMERHPDIAKGKGHYGANKTFIKQKIAELSDLVNNYGPPTRSPEEWLRVWIHFKANLKRKMTNKKSAINKKGDREEASVILNPLEESVIKLIKCEHLASSSPTLYQCSVHHEVSKGVSEEDCLTSPNHVGINDTTKIGSTSDITEKSKVNSLQCESATEKLIVEKLNNIENSINEILNIKKQKLELYELKMNELISIKRRKLNIMEEERKGQLMLAKLKIEVQRKKLYLSQKDEQ